MKDPKTSSYGSENGGVEPVVMDDSEELICYEVQHKNPLARCCRGFWDRDTAYSALGGLGLTALTGSLAALTIHSIHAGTNSLAFFDLSTAQQAFQGVVDTFMANPALCIGSALAILCVFALLLRLTAFKDNNKLGEPAGVNTEGSGDGFYQKV